MKKRINEKVVLILLSVLLVSNVLLTINAIRMNRELEEQKQINIEILDMLEAVSYTHLMDNEYMRERAADIKDVTNRVLRHLLGIKVVDLSALDEEVVLVAHDLTPSDTATMNKKMVLGFLTNIGGRTSHTAIMARTLEIAAVVGLTDITENVKDGDFVVFNGDTGEVIINPDEETKAAYAAKKQAFEEEKKALELLKGKESVTLDGRRVELAGNIGCLLYTSWKL